jgi:uncharacterized protein with HEPN domain
MSRRDWRLFVEDILESIELIENYIANMGVEAFKNDRKTIDAVVRNFEIIGEASKNIPDEIKAEHRDVNWKGMAGLRNRIAHEYFGVSSTIVWNIIKQEIPHLKEQMKQIKK